MQKERLRRELDEKLGDMQWTYTFQTKDNVVEFNNVKAESIDEKEFIRSLKGEGSKRTLEGKGDLTYSISRSGGRLWLRMFLDKDKTVGGPKKISEQEALRIFKENKEKKESGSLGGILNIFGRGRGKPPKELVPNKLSLEYHRIENLELKEEKKTKLLELTGKNFQIKLREDGDCSSLFS